MKLYKLFFNINFLFAAMLIIFFLYLFAKYRNNKGKIQKFIESFTKPNAPFFEKHKERKKTFVHEEKCREVFEKLFNKPFPNTRPDWLINPETNRRLELDGFNPEIITPIGKGLAFERDGEQHSIKNHLFNAAFGNTFEYQVFKDNIKDEVCRKNKIILIRIPYTISLSEIEDFIKKKLELHKINYNK